MNRIITIIFLVLVSLMSLTPETSGAGDPQPKKRVLILTDIENEPDDAQSMVRFLLYSNQWDATPSGDPDNNELSYSWMHYREAGTWPIWDHPATPYQAKSTVTMPQVPEIQVLHYIVAVTENGLPALTRYQRVVITVNPGK